MTTATEILKLIEAVDPLDVAKLDEIDARVQCYRNNIDFVSGFYSPTGAYWFHSKCGQPDCKCDHPDLLWSGLRYTRSRDALKAIRPEGWLFDHFVHVSPSGLRELLSYSCDGYPPNTKWEMLEGANLPTEELAELHAIIQSIDYERGAGKHGC